MGSWPSLLVVQKPQQVRLVADRRQARYVNAGKARSGQDNAYVAAGSSTGWGAVRQTRSVAANTTYRLTAWVRNSGNADHAYLGAKTTGGSVLNEVRHGRMTTGYHRVVVTFTSGTATTVVLHAGFYGPGTNAWQQLDDVSLVAV